MSSAPLPVETPMVRGPDLKILRELLKDPTAPRDFLAYLITPPWADALSSLTESLGSVATRVASATPTAQSAAIPLTTLPTSGSSGVFRFSYLADITVPATTGAGTSSLTVSVTFTQNGLNKTFSGAAITGNTNTTIQSNTWLLSADANTAIQYSTAYASDTAGQMQYGLVVTLESLNL